MNVNFEYYRIFYYVCKIPQLYQSRTYTRQQSAKCDKGHELSGAAD